ncbi:COG4626 Phage terminase-like protein, large subunit [uncultured Caudovirales phage]|uniref:COG4626 Phage terminase-like protein, large subunit n=1 Tax=uncultured Caudovirales phage TaxID=2100421 RepID=A0A6J5QJQ4_9CAUD|nr:COG4626 Phage terminase-like protein, large subunit [uncultured Caudovirales phage]CAB4214521.1 COG4626 Phage terminase-like protein, large subunit [uncultured Caudovirales phage]
MNYEDGILYAVKVVKGEIVVCRNIRLACQRFLDQLENRTWAWEFHVKYVEHFLSFAETLVHTKGPDAGKPLLLEPFQIFIICAVYGFRSKKDIGRRMVTDVIVFIPRKAGKSTLTAVIALYELMWGEAGSEVYTLATTREQAGIVFHAATGFIENMPGDIASLFNVSRHQITKAGDSQSVFKALSRDTKKTGDGMNPACAIVDEAAQIVDRNSIEVIHSGMVARKNPLRIYITTASFTKETKFYEDMTLLESMLNGEAEDNPRWFGLLYTLDPQDDWRDPSVWSKVNPMHGISVFEEAIAQRAEEAKHKPAALNEFLCKTLNVYVSANAAWVDRSFWDHPSCKTVPDRIPEAVFMGFDLAATRDLNAVCTLKRFAADDFEAEFKFFLPEDGLALIPKHYGDIFRVAKNSGILHITQGNVMDDREISDYIIAQCGKYEVKEIGFDAYNAASLVARLHDAGLPVKKVGQGMAVLSNPSKHIEKLIMQYSIKHDGNPFVGWQLGNCEVYEDVNGNVKVRKNEADKSAKVDGIISLIIAMHCNLDNPVQSGFGFRSF